MPTVRGDRPTISIVGPGRLGTALAINLRKAGWKIGCLVMRSRERVSRDVSLLARQTNARIIELDKETIPRGLVWITVPDDAIAGVAARLAQSQYWRGSIVFHSSGALTSDVLVPLHDRGAKVASVHPGMTFVRKTVPSLSGVPFGLEGDAGAIRLAKKIVASVGATAFTLRKENKVLYHAFDTFASPLFIALMAALEETGHAAGIPRARVRVMAGPLLRQTLSNYLEHGAAAAFSGPLIRGDVATIRGHLHAMKVAPVARAAYVALARVAVKELPVKNRTALKNLLRELSDQRLKAATLRDRMVLTDC